MSTDTPPELVEALRDAAASIVAGQDGPPQAVRVKATEISVEVDWSDAVGADVVGHDRTITASVEPPATDGEPEAEAPADQRYLCSPSVGTFYRCPEPNQPPFVDVGDTVHKGQQIGIVEVMKLMVPVEAEADGRITEVLRTDADPVEYGERLFAIVDAD